MSITIDTLKSYGIFEDLSDSELEILTAKFVEREFSNKEILINANESSHAIYLILEGGVSVEVPKPDGSFEELAKLSRGQTVGEFVLAKEARRSATVRATGKLKIAEIQKEVLLEVFNQHPRMGYIVFKNLAEILVDRIRDTNMVARNALGLISQQM